MKKFQREVKKDKLELKKKEWMIEIHQERRDERKKKKRVERRELK